MQVTLRSWLPPPTVVAQADPTVAGATVAKVDFFASLVGGSGGPVAIGEATAPDDGTTNRYTINWTSTVAGVYTLTATDNNNQTGASTSNPTITVSSSQQTPTPAISATDNTGPIASPQGRVTVNAISYAVAGVYGPLLATILGVKRYSSS